MLTTHLNNQGSFYSNDTLEYERDFLQRLQGEGESPVRRQIVS